MVLNKTLMISGCLCLTLLGTACQGNGKQSAGKELKEQADVQCPVGELQFPFPEIPSMLTDPSDRKAYLLKHYWDDFNFSDTALVNCRDLTEQGFVNYVALLAEENTSHALAEESMAHFCTRMLTDVHASKVMTEMVDAYLYNPNSPYYNESLYALFLRPLVESPALDEARKSRYRFKLELLGRNNPGTQATAFTYRFADGTQRGLQQTPVKGNCLLLVFYDPECPSCHETLTEMTSDPFLAEAVAKGKVSVLAVYTEGNEEAWRKALPDMPEGWMVATDRQMVKDHALYDLRAMPSLYLLDGKKKVILKDAPYARIKERLAGEFV